MSQIFRIATSQAIREIIADHGVEGRFGLILIEDGIEQIAQRVVDPFEMTLALRAKTQELFAGGGTSTAQADTRKKPRFQVEDVPFPKSKNAAEFYEFQTPQNHGAESIPHAPIHNLKLPRKRYELTLEEREKVSRK